MTAAPGMDEKELLNEIKALLEEQKRLLGELKRQSEEMAARNARHMAHSRLRFWVLVGGLLLLLLFPNILDR